MALRVLKTLDFRITTRELLWVQIFTASLEAGFSEPRAAEETDKVVEFIFNSIGAQVEAQLRNKAYPISLSASKGLGSS